MKAKAIWSLAALVLLAVCSVTLHFEEAAEASVSAYSSPVDAESDTAPDFTGRRWIKNDIAWEYAYNDSFSTWLGPDILWMFVSNNLNETGLIKFGTAAMDTTTGNYIGPAMPVDLLVTRMYANIREGSGDVSGDSFYVMSMDTAGVGETLYVFPGWDEGTDYAYKDTTDTFTIPAHTKITVAVQGSGLQHPDKPMFFIFAKPKEAP